MTLTFDRNAHTVQIAHASVMCSMSAAQFAAMAAVKGWGDVGNVLDAAKQNPGIAIAVPNESRPFVRRNYGACGVRQ